MRIAAIGDVHFDTESTGRLRPELRELPERADALLLAGDLTNHGTLDEARVVAAEFSDLGVPVIAVLGNHDHHSDADLDIAKLLTDQGITVLEGTSVTLELGGRTLGVAGTKGFGGGFAGRCAGIFGERLMREFAGHAVDLAASLGSALAELATDVTIALTHYSPVTGTLLGEPAELYPFLGSYLLGEAIDEFGADLAVHGHAHSGSEHGTTPGGVPVRNVAQPVIQAAYRVYELQPAAA
ncbi:metallophosphoesterase [Nocardia sp. NPDC051756]|uniref:metallophosphoesterase family protein n=1 Tax=Nocardia sp. NPDC051756 TaxID=3154751 RepID=UPI0034322A0C